MSKHKMLLIIPILLLLFLFSFLSSNSFVHPSLKSEAGRSYAEKTIRVGGDVNYPPYEYVDNGNYKGFNIDIMRAIGIELGLDLQFVPMNWDEAQVALQQKRIDLIQGMTYSETRSRIYDFSKPLVTNSQSIFVREDNGYIHELQDLKGASVAVEKGDISIEVLKQVPGVTLVETLTQEQGLEDLLNGTVSAFVGNRLTGLYFIQKEHRTKDIKIIGAPINPTTYAVAVLKGNEDLLRLINQGIDIMKADGTYNKIYSKWFGEQIVDESRELKKSLTAALVVAVLAILVLLVIFYWNRTLKKRVADDTRLLLEANDKLSRQKEELEKSDRLKENILESSLNGMIACDASGQILSLNTMAQKILGLDNALIGKFFADSGLGRYFDPEHLVLALMEKKITKIHEKVFLNFQGEERLLTYTVAPILDINSNVEGALVSFTDITEEKKLKEQVYLQDRMQALGQIAAGVAHELRNPLTSIKTFVELIPLKLNNADFREKIVQLVPREIDRLNRLITNLLDYTRPQEIARRAVKLEEILTPVLALLENQARNSQVTISVNCPLTTTVYGNPQQLQQVFMNLILNSLQSMENGGEITVSLGEAEQGKTALEISDNGKGIPDAVSNRVFDPFFSLRKGGTGLGLFIVYKLVTENMGEISIRSQQGKGTTVSLVFYREE